MRTGIQLIDGVFLPTPHEELLVEDERVEISGFDGVVVAGVGAEVYAHPGISVRPEIGSTVHLADGAHVVDELDGALERADYTITKWEIPIP